MPIDPAQDFVQLPPDGIGKKSAFLEVTIDGQLIYIPLSLPATPDGEWLPSDAEFGLGVDIKRTPATTTLLDDAGSGITYVGESVPGTATSAAAWRIRRITETGSDVTIQWAALAAFTQIWDNRASLTYS